MKFRPRKNKRAVHNILFVGDSKHDDEAKPLREDLGEIQVEDKQQLSKKEMRKLEKDIGEEVRLFERFKRSANILTLLAVMLFVAGIYYYAALVSVSSPDNSFVGDDDDSVVSAFERAPDYSFATTNFISFFNNINDAVFFEGNTWAASNGGLIRYNDLGAVFYGALDGLSGEVMISLAIAEGDLWVGYHGGVARYLSDEDKFQNYLTTTNDGVGVVNSRLFYDEPSKTLMLSTENAFYIYNDGLGSWQQLKDNDAPLNVENFASGSAGVFAVHLPHEDGASEIRLFDRNTKAWTKDSLVQLEEETLQVFEVNGQIVAMGETRNSLTTRYYQRRSNNWWQIDSFNSRLSSNASYLIGPQLSSERRVRVEANASTKDIYQINYKDGDFSSNRIEESFSTGPIDDRLFEPIKRAISEASGLKPHYDLQEIESGGALIATHKSDDLQFGADGVLYIRNGFDSATEILELEQGSTFIPIMCDTSAGRALIYAFAGKYDAFNEEWDNARLLKFNGKKLNKLRGLEPEELNGPWDNTQFICTERRLVWPSSGSIWSMDRTNNKVTKTGDLPDKELVGVNDSTRYFFLWDRKSIDSHVYRYDVQRGELAEIDLGRDIEEGNNIALQDNLLWVPSIKSQTIHVLTLEGEQVREIIHEGINGVEVLGAGSGRVLIVQSLKDRIYKKNFVLIDTENFSVEEIPASAIPSAATTIIDIGSGHTVFDNKNSKLWVSGVSFSIFALDI